MDLLLAETDDSLVRFEIDLYWICKAGRDPLDYFDRRPGRFPLCHVKDMTANGDMVSVGAGTIDFAEIFARSPEAGLHHFFVEHDNADDALASLSEYNADTDPRHVRRELTPDELVYLMVV